MIPKLETESRSAKLVFSERSFLLQSIGNAGKYIVRVSADQTDRADDHDENYGLSDATPCFSLSVQFFDVACHCAHEYSCTARWGSW